MALMILVGIGSVFAILGSLVIIIGISQTRRMK
jgi:hypothetical protein